MLQMPFFLIRKTVQKFHFEDVSDGEHEGWYGEYRWAQYVGHMTHWSNASNLLVCTGSVWWFVLTLFLQH